LVLDPFPHHGRIHMQKIVKIIKQKIKPGAMKSFLKGSKMNRGVPEFFGGSILLIFLIEE